MNPSLPLLLVAGLLAGSTLAQDDPATRPPAEEATAPSAPQNVELGKKVPDDIRLPDIDGKLHTTADFEDRITVVDFWSIECPISRGWEPTLKSIVHDYHDRGVTFLIVNANETNGEIADGEPKTPDDEPYQRIRSYLAEHELPYTVLVDHDSEVANRFDAKTTPDVFVFDKDGRLVYRGLIDDDLRREKGDRAQRYLRDTLDALLAGRSVEPHATKPQGCSIKRPMQRPHRGRRADR